MSELFAQDTKALLSSLVKNGFACVNSFALSECVLVGAKQILSFNSCVEQSSWLCLQEQMEPKSLEIIPNTVYLPLSVLTELI